MTLREFWTASGFQAITRGQWAGSGPAAGDVPLSGVGIDSRTIGHGQAFIAIEGERFDGHDFLIEAVSNGAALLMVERCEANTLEAVERESSARNGAGVPVLIVDSTIAALARLAADYRLRLAPSTTVIGITGTNGKTTTRRILQTVLSHTMKGTASIRSFNNHIGVPLTILGAGEDGRFLIAEVGTNAPGEIASLAEILRPNIAVITSIGAGHLERLGTVHDVAIEKTTLLRFMPPGENCLAVVNADAGIEPALLSDACQVTTFGWSKPADLRISLCQESVTGTHFQLNDGSHWHLPLLGRHNAANAAVAIIVGRRLGMSETAIRAGLSAVTPEPMRLEPIGLADGTLIVNDAYNANPDSMRAALECLVRISADCPAVAVLGDMLELGPDSPRYHRSLVQLGMRYLAEGALQRLILIGPMMSQAAGAETVGAAGDGIIIVSAECDDATLTSLAARSVLPGDVVLVKGSRGMALERFVGAVQARSADRKKKERSCS